MIRLMRREAVGTGKHRAGWPHVLSLLERLESPDGILFDDFVELNFLYGPARAHDEPWVGIYHHPPNLPPQISGPMTHLSMFSQPAWMASLPHLKLGFALTEYLAASLRSRLTVPIVTLNYPTPTPQRTFTEDRFLSNDDRKIVQIGWPWRNTLAIDQLAPVPGFAKAVIDHADTPRTGWVDRYNARVQAFWKGRPRPLPGGTTRIARLNDQQYDNLLSANVVFLELFDCSAKTIVVECIARTTPIVVNRHPALEEYLGRDYPLFYGRFDDAPALFSTDRLLEGHHYLCAMDKTLLSDDHFLDRVTSALNRVAPIV